MPEYDIGFQIMIASATRNQLFPVLIKSLTTAVRETNPIVWRVRTSDKSGSKWTDATPR